MNHRPTRRVRRASASPLFTPHGTDRAGRKAARRRLAEAAAKARDAAVSHPAGTGSAEQEMPPPAYPAGGRPGPASARGGTLTLPAHRMTIAVAAGAYPFLAEGGLGAEGMYIGRDVHAEASFCFDPFALYGRVEGFTNPNVLLAGVIGQGKSALAKSFALRSVAFGYRVYVPCDPKGEWTPVAQALGGTSIALGPGLPGRLNPLDAAPRPASVSETDWAGEIRKRRLLLLGSLARTVLGRDLLPVEHTALDVALDSVVAHATEAGRTPLLGHIAAALNSPEQLDAAAGTMSGRLGDAARDLAHALRRLVHGDLAGMFDAPSTVAFDPTSPMLTIDLSRLGGSGDDTALVLAMTCASAWMESALTDPDGGRRWIVYDEAWRLMRHPGLLQRMQAQWKLSRGLGIANLMVIHRLSDLRTAGDAGSRGRALAEGLLADCSTRIIYRQETDQLHAAAALLGLTSVETEAIAHLNRGRGLWRVAGRSFVVQHPCTHARPPCSTPTPACTPRPRLLPGENLTTMRGTPPASPVPTTPTDPGGHYVHGRAVLGLTDRLNTAGTYEEAAALTDHIINPTDGLLERLADFFEAAAEKARDAESEDGFDLRDDLDHAAASLRSLGEDLHTATDRMRALAPPPQAAGPSRRVAAAAMPPPPAATPGRTR